MNKTTYRVTTTRVLHGGSRMTTHSQWSAVKLRSELNRILNSLEDRGLSPLTDSSQAIELRDGWTLVYQGSHDDNPGQWAWIKEV